MTERHIEIAVEVLIDFANLLIAKNAWPRPASAPKAVQTLVARKAISARLGRSLVAWIRTRNVIVHLYADVDHARLHRSLRLHLKALRSGLSTLARACGIAP